MTGLRSRERLPQNVKPVDMAFRRQRAASLTGYGLIVGLIAIAAIAAVSDVGQRVTELFGGVATQMAGATGGSGGSGDGGEDLPLSLEVPLPDQDWSVLAEWVFSVPDGTFSDDSATLSATLANGDPLPLWLNFDGEAFSGSPPADQGGTLDLRVTATQGSESVSDTFTLTINGFALSSENSFVDANMNSFVCDQTLAAGAPTSGPTSANCLVTWVVPTDNVTAVTLVFETNPVRLFFSSSCHEGRWNQRLDFYEDGSQVVGGGFAQSRSGENNFSYNGFRFDDPVKYCQDGLNGQFESGAQCTAAMPSVTDRKTETLSYVAGDQTVAISIAQAASPGSPFWNLTFDALQPLPVLNQGDEIIFRPSAQPPLSNCPVSSTNNGEYRVVSIELETAP